MSMGRITKLTLMLLLVVGLGASLAMSDGRLSAPMAHATLSAGPGPNDCNPCGNCDRPCMVHAVCSTPCIPLGLFTARPQVTSHQADRLIPEASWSLSSVALRIPTPPPRLSHFV